jgi:hypothetical protein
MYTVRINKSGSGEDISLVHYEYLSDAIDLVKRFVKKGFVATIWQYDSKKIR